MTLSIPLPNDEFDGATVVASVWMNDMPEYGEISVLLLLLDKAGPYYRTVQVMESNIIPGYWGTIVNIGQAYNINDAVRQFADNGGDN